MTSRIEVTNPSEGVRIVRVDAPPANRFNYALREELLKVLDEAERDEAVRAIVLTGTGEAFCAGDDLREAVTRGDQAVDGLKQFGRMLDLIEQGRVPVIAAVNGHAVGGGFELALACDIRIGSTSANFIAAGVNVGLMASVYRLPRLIGISRAKAILLTGLPVRAEQALSHGIITELHAPAELMPAALKLAERIASRAPLSVEATKRQVDRVYGMERAEAMRAAVGELATLTKTRDHFEAVDAFVNKRQPVFARS
ncbi:enoyl-CoA hydratase/isomerase family protein [Sphingomonas sp. 36D10-4-7]|uniref:Enoyl-CoA hydratase/isomerase family protein n=2 Tax=Sphingomonas corticis TaxID=2722791 RepID=A0ABX1CVX7_9SPHN|nr:enoyl-CoA hydratase/isomerase family protein [Sphingomonas corticis]